MVYNKQKVSHFHHFIQTVISFDRQFTQNFRLSSDFFPLFLRQEKSAQFSPGFFLFSEKAAYLSTVFYIQLSKKEGI